MNSSNNVSISGTQVKLNIHIEPLGSLSMADYDFECKFFIFPKKFVLITKNDMIKVDNNNYLAMVDTTGLGTGQMHLTLTAFIPDTDFESVRREVVCVNTGINVVNC